MATKPRPKGRDNGYTPEKYRANRQYYLDAVRVYKQKHPRRVQDTRLRSTFGISLVEYERMLAAQGGVCDICKQPETMVWQGKVRALAVDHNHTTTKVRALLCKRCNSILGYVKEDATILRAAADYLRRHNDGE